MLIMFMIQKCELGYTSGVSETEKIAEIETENTEKQEDEPRDKHE